MAELVDSGVRREFSTGAVRDIADGKGRCDLLPLGIVADFLGSGIESDKVLNMVELYLRTGDTDWLLRAMEAFCKKKGIDKYTAIIEASKQYEDGARKYADHNWEKGMPVHCFIDSGVRHYLKWLRGDDDEPHDRAFLWNMLGAVWMHQNHPELIDLPFAQKDEKAS